MLVLRVGDPHVQNSNLEESNRLFNFIAKVALEAKVDRIELLGDLNHTHDVVRIGQLEFWNTWLAHLSSIAETVVLVGNHDRKGDYSSNSHSLSVFNGMYSNLLIVNAPVGWHGHTAYDPGIGYLPYCHDKEQFVKDSNQLFDQGFKVQVCHQTFVGGKYESGIYAPDGIDVSLLKAELIISGHLHTAQRFGKVIYPGTARWMTASDANLEKGIWLVEHNSAGLISGEKFISTENVCTPIRKFVWNEGEEKPSIPDHVKATVELVGSSKWIEKQRPSLKGTSVSVTVTDQRKARWQSSDGHTIKSFIDEQFELSSGLSKEELLTYMKEELDLV